MSLHGDAVHTLTAWTARDQTQDRLRRAYLDYLAEHADAMWRSCVPAHLTASALVVSAEVDRVLLVRHSKAHIWLQMGGHCEPGDHTLADAALREATEESGIPGLVLVPGPLRLDRHPATCGATHHLDVQFVALAPAGSRATTSAGSDPVDWFPIDALPELTDDAVRRLVSAALERLGEVGEEILGVLEADREPQHPGVGLR